MKTIFPVLVFLLLISSCGHKEIVSTEPVNDTPLEEIKNEISPEIVKNHSEQEPFVMDQSILDDKGYGPVISITLEAIDPELVAQGKQLFHNNCTACHRINKKHIGPKISGITKRRSPEWIMNIIFNPQEMMEKNPAAIQLLEEYKAPMPNQYLNIDEVRSILEYFRSIG